ncbi:MAG: hypothetical protein MJK04_14730, partial [Psychrosphaera sp.]|nr:hypothetical protein [Psychrosphaera sp.]
MKNKLKKSLFALIVGMSASAWAVPPATVCDSICIECKSVNDFECAKWYSGFCHTSNKITCHPRGA